MRPGTAFVLSLLLHAVAVVGLGLGALTPRPAVQPRPAIVWITAPAAKPPAPVESPLPAEVPDQRPGRMQPVERGAARAGSPPAPPPAARPEPPFTPASPARTGEAGADLAAASRRAAADLLEARDRAGAYRSFTFPGTIAEQQAFEQEQRLRRVEHGLQAPLTAFDSPAKGRAGITETNSFGKKTRWISDDCYQTTGSNNLFLLPAIAGLFAIPTTSCTNPLPRGDLFAAAKPDYLMDADERVAAAAAAARRERLRRPTTGVVMSLEEE